jgi:hypothetical protein
MSEQAKKYLESLKKRTSKVSQILDEVAGPHLGVFWMHPKTNEIISPYAEPVAQGIKDPELGITDAGATHASLWPVVKDLHPDLKHLNYDEVPRGRVFYNHEKSKFTVWGSKSHMDDPHIQNQVLDTYKLPKNKTTFQPKRDYDLGRRSDTTDYEDYPERD